MTVLLSSALLLALATAIVWRDVRHLMHGEAWRGMTSLVAALTYIFALWVPCVLQVNGAIQGKLQRLGFAAAPTSGELVSLTLHWVVELVIIVLGELSAAAVMDRRYSQRPQPPAEGLSLQVPERVTVALLVIGTIAVTYFPADPDQRGIGGQGVTVLLRDFLLVGLAALFHARFYRRWTYAIVGLVGICFLLANQVRSPLLVILCATIVSYLQAPPRHFARVMALAVSTTLVFVLAGSIQSTYRGNLRTDTNASILSATAETMQSPWTAAYRSGVDTLDGYRFSKLVSPIEPARPLDPLTIITNFVPRSLWPDKPTTLTVYLSSKYLSYNTSGQFLSPMGYLLLIAGGYGLALICLLFVTMAFCLALRRTRHSFWMVLVTVALIRFMIAGSSFDIYYAVVLSIPLVTLSLFVGDRGPTRRGDVWTNGALPSPPQPRHDPVRP